MRRQFRGFILISLCGAPILPRLLTSQPQVCVSDMVHYLIWIWPGAELGRVVKSSLTISATRRVSTSAGFGRRTEPFTKRVSASSARVCAASMACVKQHDTHARGVYQCVYPLRIGTHATHSFKSMDLMLNLTVSSHPEATPGGGGRRGQEP